MTAPSLPLPSTIDRPVIERRIRRAFRHWSGVRPGVPLGRRFQTFYEHGHWWVRLAGRADEPDRTFDAVDAEGGDAVDGFGFEEV